MQIPKKKKKKNDNKLNEGNETLLCNTYSIDITAQ